MSIIKRFSSLIPFIVFFVIILAAYLLFNEQKHSLEKEINNDIKYISREMTGRIYYRMRTYEQVLKGLRGFYSADGYVVPRKAFLDYAEQLEISMNLPGVQAVGFSSYVAEKDVSKHVQQALSEGYDYYTFRTDKKKSHYMMVDIMFPDDEENRRVYGFDLTSEPVRAEMLRYAVKQHQTGLSRKIVLKQELTDHDAPAGVLMSMPVYKNGVLMGVISAPFRVNDLMYGIFRGDTKGLAVRVYDTQEAPENMLYESCNCDDILDGYTVTYPIKMYGRTWIVRADATGQYMSQFDTNKPYIILACIVVIAVLLTALTQMVLITRNKTYNMAKRIAGRLAESENRFHQTFEQASAGIVITSMGLRIMSANRSFRDIVKCSDMEISGTLLTEMIASPDRDEISSKLEQLKSESIKEYKTEKRMISRTSGEVWTEISASVYYDTNGVARYLIFVIQDISGKKAAEEALVELSMQQAAILNNSLTGIMRVRNRKVEWVNTAFEDLFGYTNAEMIGSSTRILHPTDDEFETFGRHMDNYEKMMEKGFVQTKVRMQKKTGETIWVDISGKLISDSPQSPSIWVMNDVTQEKQAQDGLIELNATLENRVDDESRKRIEQERLFMQQGRMAAMGEMIGAIAHQWRQPLNIVSLVVQNISDDFNDSSLTKEEMAMYLENVMEQLQHMSCTIDDFRNFFQIAKDTVVFDPSEQVSRVLHLISAQFKAHNVKVSLINGTPCFINGIPNELSQVILNIINNSKDAFLANKIESPSITIGVGLEDKDAVISISDNGGGIPEHITERVFEPYFTTKKKDIGTGIGLYMSKMIVNDHFGGSVNFENIENGVRFVIRIPAVNS